MGGMRPDYSFGGSVRLCLNRYVQFSGRAPRAEYWYFVLFTVLVGIGAQILDAALLNGSAVFAPLANLALFLPGLAVGVRRLHDRDRSGWWWLIGLIPVVGAIVLIVWFASRGTRGSNRFGYDPLPF